MFNNSLVLTYSIHIFCERVLEFQAQNLGPMVFRVPNQKHLSQKQKRKSSPMLTREADLQPLAPYITNINHSCKPTYQKSKTSFGMGFQYFLISLFFLRFNNVSSYLFIYLFVVIFLKTSKAWKQRYKL